MHSRNRMAGLLCLIVLAAVCQATSAPLVPHQAAANAVYAPGYVSIGVPLSLFVSPSLRPACEELQSGSLTAAKEAFEAEIRQRPDDLPAYIGLSQATITDRETLLKKSLQEQATNISPAHQFQTGVLAYYLLGERWQYYTQDPAGDAERRRLSKIAVQNLQSAYEHTHAPVAGFMLAGAPPFLQPLSSEYYPQAIYMDLLRRVGGDAAYRTYVRAEQSGWKTDQPPVPDLPKDRLLIFHKIIREFYSQHSARRGVVTQRTINGYLVESTRTEPYTKVQQQAMTYLRAWADRVKKVAEKK